MKRLVVLLAIFILCSVFLSGNILAANPDKIKVGILLPLTARLRRWLKPREMVRCWRWM